jgi:hypothetical protein
MSKNWEKIFYRYVFLFQMHLEATLLQAKVHFYQCSYQSALTMYEHANLDTVTVSGSSPRVLHIIAEAYAIKGNVVYLDCHVFIFSHEIACFHCSITNT